MALSYEILEVNEPAKFISFKVHQGRDVFINNVAGCEPRTWTHAAHIREFVEEYVRKHYPEQDNAALMAELKGETRLD